MYRPAYRASYGLAVALLSLGLFLPSNGVASAHSSASSAIIGAWHCHIPGTENAEASSDINYVFRSHGAATYDSDKTGGTQVPFTYRFDGKHLMYGKFSDPATISHNMMTINGGNLMGSYVCKRK